ncbi:MAG: serine/threonine protein kinase [Pirellula sp.]|nr:serine/threonine protein kinase [Pirellula sp.]
MPFHGTVSELLEEILESGRSAEDVCADCPELLDQVREQLQKLSDVELQIESLFPLSQTAVRSDQHAAASGIADLPPIHDHEIQTILGRGGMGVVYQARHVKLNRIVAVKMLLAGSHAGRQQYLRFMREAEAVAALKHANIVQIYDFGEVSGQPYFTMEFVDGGSLAQKLAHSPLSARESAQLLTALAQAVGAAHRSGIIHRDLKPANILIAAGNTPKISDFGLARRIDVDDGLTQTGVLVGTPTYMAPEQMTGVSTAIGPAVDIFALGAVLYEMLTGHPPFRGESFSDVQRRVMREEPVPPSRINAKVPRDLETICLKCLEKESKKRYATADDLAADLERFLRHEPIRARPTGTAGRVMRWVRRNPLPTVLSVTAIVLIGLIISEGVQEWALAAGRRAEKSRLTARFESGVQLVQEGRFAEAKAILGKLGDGGHEDLRLRIDRTLAELELVEKLDAIGVDRAVAVSGSNEARRLNGIAANGYAAVFAQFGMNRTSGDPGSIAQRIKDSDIRHALVEALDDWSVCEADEVSRNSILEVIRHADSDAGTWHQRVRNPANWIARAELSQLAESAPTTSRNVHLLRAFGDRLAAAGLDSIAFRKRLQQDHADCYLTNLSLADALRDKDPAESIRFYQAALAIRPRAIPAWNNLAVALSGVGRTDEALFHFQHAKELDPQSVYVRYNLGLALSAAQQAEGAVTELQQAVALAPDFAPAYIALDKELIKARRYAEAEAVLRRGLDAVPLDDPNRTELRDLLRRCLQLQSSGD